MDMRSLQRLLRRLVWFIPVIIVAASLVPHDLQIRPGLNKQFEHFAAYLSTAFLFALAYPGRRRGAFIFAGLVACAASMEVLQVLAPGRTPHLLDFAAGALGVGAGLALAMPAISLLRPFLARWSA